MAKSLAEIAKSALSALIEIITKEMIAIRPRGLPFLFTSNRWGRNHQVMEEAGTLQWGMQLIAPEE